VLIILVDVSSSLVIPVLSLDKKDLEDAVSDSVT
jgi:hypothetical protein